MQPFEPRSEFGIWGSTPYASRKWMRVMTLIALAAQLRGDHDDRL